MAQFRLHELKHVQAGIDMMKRSKGYDQRDEIYLHRYCSTFGMTLFEVRQIQRTYPAIKTVAQYRNFLRDMIQIIDQRYTPYSSVPEQKEDNCSEVEKLLMYRTKEKQPAFSNLTEWMDVADMMWGNIRRVAATRTTTFASSASMKKYQWSIIQPQAYTESKLSSGLTMKPSVQPKEGTVKDRFVLCPDGKDRLM